MGRMIWAALLVGLSVTPVWAADQNVLTWTDNSNNEQNFNIQRTTAASVAACATASGWTALASVGPNITTYTDTAVVQGTTYCYQVDASNTAGVSPFSNIAGRTVPFTVPASPSGLTVN